MTSDYQCGRTRLAKITTSGLTVGVSWNVSPLSPLFLRVQDYYFKRHTTRDTRHKKKTRAIFCVCVDVFHSFSRSLRAVPFSGGTPEAGFILCSILITTTRRRGTLPSCGSNGRRLSRKLFHIILNGKPISCELNAAGVLSLCLSLSLSLSGNCRAERPSGRAGAEGQRRIVKQTDGRAHTRREGGQRSWKPRGWVG